MATNINKVQPADRIPLLKSGKRTFLSTVKLQISPETEWLLLAVCIDGAPQPLEQDVNHTIYDQADFYLLSVLHNNETKLNTDRDLWVKSMRT